ncbi:MAG: hypothetical protein ACLFP2_03440 [Candidatus Woesearchaeota archaeon]
MLTARKGQTWYMDLFLGMVIFMIAFTILLKSSTNLSSEKQDLSERIKIEGSLMSKMLLSEGIPGNWTNESVSQIGLLSNKRINATKVSNFTAIDYGRTRDLTRLLFDYHFHFTNGTDIISINGRKNFGYPGVNSTNVTNLDPEYLLRINRLTIYNSSIVKMVLYLWQ